jgi:hypothetical protein
MMSLDVAAALLADHNSSIASSPHRASSSHHGIGVDLGLIDPYTAGVLAETNAAENRAAEIRQLAMPQSVDAFLEVARTSLSELHQLAYDFRAVVDDYDRQWLDKLDEASALIDGAWRESGGGSGMSGSGSGNEGGGSGKPPHSSSVSVVGRADSQSVVAQFDSEQRSWWGKLTATVVAFAQRAAIVAAEIGKKMASAVAARVKSVVAIAWNQFWNSAASIIGQILSNAALGFVGLNGT